jgi:hypothetical protein
MQGARTKYCYHRHQVSQDSSASPAPQATAVESSRTADPVFSGSLNPLHYLAKSSILQNSVGLGAPSPSSGQSTPVASSNSHNNSFPISTILAKILCQLLKPGTNRQNQRVEQRKLQEHMLQSRSSNTIATTRKDSSTTCLQTLESHLQKRIIPLQV